MSFSAPQSKMPSPARTPRVSGEEELRPTPTQKANKPTGIINLGMTCFLNSTFQALAATPAIISLLSNNPALPLVPVLGSPLPPPRQLPLLTPCLLPDALEPPLYQLLPVTRAFTNSLYKAWTTKERGGGTAGPGEQSSIHSISLSQLLREIARKYDQYDAFAQQDAHELLRHLLDSMEMEEKDVIKRKNPPKTPASTASTVPPATPKSVNAGLSPSTSSSSLPPTTACPVSPALSAVPLGEERMLPFVDSLFGGLLASVVVCDTCKSVSHTYEGFLDLSLSMRGDDSAPARKRDRFRLSFASKLKNRSVSKMGGMDSVGVMSEPEGSDSEHARGGRHGHGFGHTHGHHRAHSDLESEPATPGGSTSLTRASSSAKNLKTSFSFRRGKKTPKETTPSSSASPGPSLQPLPLPSTPDLLAPTPSISPALSPNIATESPPQGIFPPVPHSPHMHTHQAAPTPAQAAYIARILYGPPAAPEAFDPLAKLRAAHAGGLNGINSAKPQEYGLIESLRAFTSVETLEGDNAFACHKCWKIKNGHYKRGKENGDGGPFSSKRPSTIALPSIAVDDSEAEGPGGSTPGTTEMSRLGRLMSRGKGGVARAASPLRQLVDSTTSPESPDAPFSMSLPEDISRTETTLSTASATSATSMSSAATTDTSVTGATVGASTVFSASVPSTATAESFLTNDSDPTDKEADAAASSDGLSDSTDDEDLPSGSARFFRPPIRGRHTKHFVLRRAFKRYLIAKAPEVLVFHIKRFRQTGSGVYSTFSNLKKLDDMVTFPETLDLAPFMAPNRTDFKTVRMPGGPLHAPYMDWAAPERPPDSPPMPYKLYAVVVHLGTMLSGHYIAYVLVDPEVVFLPQGEAAPPPDVQGLSLEDKDQEPKKDRRVWCYCSDTNIRLASVEEVLSARAYLCFYERVRQA